MVAASTAPHWLRHQQAQALLSFNLLPSLTLHPSHTSNWVPRELLERLQPSSGEQPLVAPATLHRHWSSAMLDKLQLPLADRLDEPALPLAMASPPLFEQTVFFCGLALASPHIRTTIEREQVLRLGKEIGAEGLAFARQQARQMVPSGAPLERFDVGRAASCCRQWGSGLLARVFGHCTPAVGRRGLLRLPEVVEAWEATLPAHAPKGAAALDLAREVLTFTDSVWLSSFPATR